MFKKNQLMGLSEADKKMEQYINEQFFNLSKDLREKAKQVYIKNEALKVYDSEKAEKDLIEAKNSLICFIENYDALIAEIKDYFTKHYVEFKFPWMMDFPTSHKIIEEAIRDIFKEGY